MLMGTNVPAISKHIANIYSTKELSKTSTVSKMEIVRMEGSRLDAKMHHIWQILY